MICCPRFGNAQTAESPCLRQRVRVPGLRTAAERPAGKDTDMDLHFPRLYKNERMEEPCAVSVPFAPGRFREGMGIRILDGERTLPVQSSVLSAWPDGSARYLFVRFAADLPGNARKELKVEVLPEAQAAPAGIRISREGDCLRVDGGEGGLRFVLKENSGRLMERLEDGRKTYEGDQFVGPRLKDGEGQTYLPCYSEWTVEEAGPLAAVLRGRGELIPEGEIAAEERPTFETKLTVYRGKPWMETAFRLINSTGEALHAASFVFAVMTGPEAAYDGRLSGITRRERGDSVGEGSTAAGQVLEEDRVYQTTGTKLLGEIEERFPAGALRCCAASSNYKTNFTVSGGEAVERAVDTAWLMAEANEHFAEVFYGTLFADRTEGAGGVCATVFQAQQNYPKAVRSDRSGVYVMLIPDGVEKVVFESGMSREQRFLLHFHGAEEPLSELDNRSLIYQMPDRPWLDPEVYRDAGVCPDIFLSPEQTRDEVEIALINRCDAHSRSFGMLNFGDAPDMNYTRQGRGKGMLVWTNNEYDFPHACALEYMRTGERRFLDYVIASAGHWMDVDVCHWSRDPLRVGGQWEHCRRHVLDSTMVCSHEWVEGLLDLYHFTGDERARETALGIGENVLRLLDTPAYQVHGESNARETGWALRSLTALYVETGEPRWLEKAEWIVGQFREWTEDYGGWVAPYTDNTMIHVPFMIAVAMGSLYRYYEVFPKEEIRKLLLDAADDLIESSMTPYGLFFYKELPSLNRLGNNTMVLEALAIAYRLSGNKTYLEKGLKTFRKDIAGKSGVIGEKKVAEGAVLLENDPPKHFAQSFIPLVLYYKAAAEAGLI